LRGVQAADDGGQIAQSIRQIVGRGRAFDRYRTAEMARARLLIVAFVIAAGAFLVFPGLDLATSGLFFVPGQGEHGAELADDLQRFCSLYGGENIAYGQLSADEVMQDWMNSAGHKANILNCSFKAIGVGIGHGGSYGTYWTQDFGSR